MYEYAVPLTVGILIGIITGAALVFWIISAAVREVKRREVDRLENVAATITAWSMHAERFHNIGLATALQLQADQIADEAERVSKSL